MMFGVNSTIWKDNMIQYTCIYIKLDTVWIKVNENVQHLKVSALHYRSCYIMAGNNTVFHGPP